MNNLISNILKLTEHNYFVQNLRYYIFNDKVYIVPTWSIFAGLVTFYQLPGFQIDQEKLIINAIKQQESRTEQAKMVLMTS